MICVSSLSFAQGVLPEKHHLEPLISAQEIQERVLATAEMLDTEYKGRELVMVIVMKGAVCVGADLLRALHIPCSLEYVRASSYGKHGDVRGELTVLGVDQLDITGKDVLLVDDIFDSGVTLQTVAEKLQEKNPRSLKTLVLLSKNVPHVATIVPDYTLFHVENYFVVGYGLDYKESFRGLPAVYKVVRCACGKN